jgi:hypothetical protein
MGIELADVLDRYAPEHMEEGIWAYVNDGRPPGDFLKAVLANDLFAALSHADPVNGAALVNYRAILMALPPSSWGSYRNIEVWIGKGGVRGVKEYG